VTSSNPNQRRRTGGKTQRSQILPLRNRGISSLPKTALESKHLGWAEIMEIESEMFRGAVRMNLRR
jgi:hypothetical protein